MRFTHPALTYVSTAMSIAEHSIGNPGLIPDDYTWSSEPSFNTCFASIMMERSPWLALHRTGVPLLISTDTWPKIISMSLDDIVLSRFGNNPAHWDMTLHVLLRLTCPFCHQVSDYTVRLLGFPYQSCFDRLVCPDCSAQPWPFRSLQSLPAFADIPTVPLQQTSNN